MGGILPICPYFSLMHRRSANLFFLLLVGGNWGLNSGLGTCKAGALPLESHFQFCGLQP
jgi:hypothetical protein